MTFNNWMLHKSQDTVNFMLGAVSSLGTLGFSLLEAVEVGFRLVSLGLGIALAGFTIHLTVLRIKNEKMKNKQLKEDQE